MPGTDDHKNSVGADSKKYPDVCVVTHPLGAAGENATRTLLEILAAITSVRLVTADLPADSKIHDRHTLVELTEQGAGQSNVVIAAVRFILNQLRMCRAIAGSDEEVILFFGATAYVLPMLWARLLGRTVIVEPRGNVPLTLRLDWEQRMPAGLARAFAMPVWFLERFSYRIANVIVTYTPAMAEELNLEQYESKLYLHGARYVDTEKFTPETPFEERNQVVGFLGRLEEEKGIRDLTVAIRHLPDDVTFRFVGDGNLKNWARDRLADEREAGRVEFTGWVEHDDVPVELNRLRLLVMPSRPTEGLPTTILEALACGTPVYATPVAGVPDVVIEEETGFHMTETDPQGIAAGVEQAVNREDLAMIGRNGRKLMVSEYGFESAVDRYQSLLTRL